MSLRVVFLGRNEAAALALEDMVERGVEVVLVVAPRGEEGREYRPGLLAERARRMGLRVGGPDEIEGQMGPEGTGSPVDLLISFLYWRKVPAQLLFLPRLGAFNFHPGPLPEFRGGRGYSHALLEGVEEYGASLHWMTEQFDAGDLVEVRRFPVRPTDSALSLYQRTIRTMRAMSADFVDTCLRGRPIPRVPQEGVAGWSSRTEMLQMTTVRPDDSPEAVRRKARAFWFPPFTGATVNLNGEEFTLVDRTTVELLGAYLHRRLLSDEDDL